MNDYPGLAGWHQRMAQQQGGMLALALICCAVLLYALWIARRYPDGSRGRMFARLGAAVAVGAAGAGALIGQPVLILIAFGGLGAAYYRFFGRSNPLLWIMVGALALRLPGMLESFWYDETFTAALAALPLPRLGALVASDVHPPLWYLIEFLTVRILGSSEPALRLPALLFGLLSIWLAYRLARLVSSERAALALALLIAVMPMHIRYSNEARGYTLLMCAVLLMALAVESGRHRLFVFGAVLAVLTHNLAWIYAGVLALWAIYRHGIRWALPMAAIWGGMFPWLPVMLYQSQDVANGFWMAPLQAGGVVAPFVNAWGLRITDSVPLLFVAGAAVLLTMASLWICRRFLTGQGAIITMVALICPALLALLSTGWHNVYLERAMLVSVGLIPLLWAVAWEQLPKGDKTIAYAIAGPALALALITYPQGARDNLRGLLPLACYGTSEYYASSLPAAFITAYYLDTPTLWAGAGDLNQWLSQEAIEALGWQRAEQPGPGACWIIMETPLSSASEIAMLPDSSPFFTNSIYSLRVARNGS